MIPQNDFDTLKRLIPQVTTVHKATKKIILTVYENMNDELNNLSLNRLDQEHPKVIARRNIYNYMNSLSKNYKDNYYGRYF